MIHFSLVLASRHIGTCPVVLLVIPEQKKPHDQIISALFFLTHLANLCSPAGNAGVLLCHHVAR